MEVWQFVLYGVASLLALRALASLMIHHKRQYKNRLLAEQEQQRRAERAKSRQAEKNKKSTGPKKTNGAAA